MKNGLVNFFNKNKNCFIIILGIAAILVAYTNVYGRAGGGGGSSSNGDGGLFELIFWILMMIPFPYNLIVIAIIVILAYIFRKKTREASVLNKLPTQDTVEIAKGYNQFIANNVGFNLDKFRQKVHTAFIDIQYAWQAKNLGKVRKYLSDGVYQRFNTQFKMMDILQQTNTIEQLELRKIVIDKIESDGKFDIIHVAIMANIKDKFVSTKYPQLNSGGEESFVEYWSFIRRRGIAESDLFTTQNCPKCGGELPKNAGDVSRCEFCGTITNLGDYDWVLSEITQADDYIASSAKFSKESNLAEKIRTQFNNDDDFSIQQIEDKASNGYLQIETAKVLKNKTIMRRFVSDELFTKLSDEVSKTTYVYNRIFLNDVTLIAASQKDNKNVLNVAIKSSYQRVIPDEKSIIKMEEVVVSKTEIVTMVRDIDFSNNKGSLYAHSCPSCGGPIADTIDLKCSYCGAEINSTKNEWIITDIIPYSQFNTYYEQNKDEFSSAINPNKIDSLYNVRDYALNNILILMAADGIFDNAERAFAEKIAKRWGYNVNKIQPMFDMAKSGKLVLRMPENQRQRNKIYYMMEKAAKIDGNVSEQEQKLLNYIKQQYIMAS